MCGVEIDVRFVPATDISGAAVDQLAYPPPTLRLVFWLNWCSAHCAHKQERFGTAPADQRELGKAWWAQVEAIAVLPDAAS